MTDLHCNFRDVNTDELCTADPTRVVTSGCQHEHLATFAYCTEHADKLVEGTAGCWPCWRDARVDAARVVVADRWLSGADL